MSKPAILRIGWVGCGYHSYNLLVDCLRNTNAAVTAFCDTDPERLALFGRRYAAPAQYSDYMEMLDKEPLDAVVCVIGAEMHYRVALACLKRGIPIFIEKTPCETSAQARELSALQKDGKAFVMPGFNRRYAMGYVLAKRLMRTPAFGQPTMYMAKYNASGYRSEKFYLFNHIVHHLDLARFLCGEITLTHVDRVRVDDQHVGFHIQFKNAEGMIGFIQSGSLQTIDFPMEKVEITGVGTNLIVDNIKRLEYNRPPTRKLTSAAADMCNENDALCWQLNHGNLIENDLNGFKDEMERFISCVENGAAPEYTIADSVHSMALLEQLMAMVEAL